MPEEGGFGHHEDPTLDFLSEVGRIAKAWDAQPEGDELTGLAAAAITALDRARDLPSDGIVEQGRAVLGEISAGIDALLPRPDAAMLPADHRELAALLAKRGRMERTASELRQPCHHPGEPNTVGLLEHAARRMTVLEACLRAVAGELDPAFAQGTLPEDPETYRSLLAASRTAA